MRLAADPEVASWVDRLEGKPDDFDWDQGNLNKNRKHGVEARDIESVLRGSVAFSGRIVDEEHAEPRWLLLGQDVRGRYLALIFTRRGRRLRPISCRPMRDGERKFYEAQVPKGGETR